MKQHGLNALALARALHASPYVDEVLYPGLKSHPRYELAKEVVLTSEAAREWIESELGGFETVERERGGVPFSGMLSFRIRGGKEEAERFLSRLKIFALAESLGGVESLAEVPAEMTHKSIPDEARELLGIGQSLIRLSAGVEEMRDLVRDVEQALEWAVAGERGYESSESGERLTPSSSSSLSLKSSGASSTSIESLADAKSEPVKQD
jgi:cystathionine gamma-lyase